MGKRKIPNHGPQGEVEAVEEQSGKNYFPMPTDYTLGKGDKYVAYDVSTDEYLQLDTSSYFVTFGDEPEEPTGDNGERIPFQENSTIWYNASPEVNSVFIFKGRDPAGKAIWSEDPIQPRYVLTLEESEGVKAGELVGVIVNKNVDFVKAVHEQTEAVLQEKVGNEPPSIDSLLDEQ